MFKAHQLSWLTSAGLLVVTISWTMAKTGADAQSHYDSAQAADGEQAAVYSMLELEAQREELGRSYLPFLDRSTLSCGVYFLAAGSTDGQSPHQQDEVYYVRSGKATLTVEGEDFVAEPGAVLFVAANAEHRFRDIEEDLTLLVFFSKAPADD